MPLPVNTVKADAKKVGIKEKPYIAPRMRLESNPRRMAWEVLGDGIQSKMVKIAKMVITGLHAARVQVQHEHRTVADLIESVNEQEYWDVLRYAHDDIEEAEVIDEAP